MKNPTIEELLGIKPRRRAARMSFSFLFFSDVRTDVTNAEKYAFMRDVTLFADREGFEAIYIPERHFYEFGSIYANPAIVAAYLIPQTKQIRFRSAGVSLPLHHPTEVVEWWAMNDILSGGRVDLGFGSGWNKPDFITAPENFERRREICSERIEIVRRLWRGEEIAFPGPGGEECKVTVFPRPIQPELNVWLLVAQNDEAFAHAGRQGYNVFTMLYGVNLDAMSRKIARYREGRKAAGRDPAAGRVTLMLHTLVDQNLAIVKSAVEKPFKEYIKSALDAHARAGIVNGTATVGEDEKSRILEYSYERYCKTGALFGSVDDARKVVDEALAAGVDEIACLVDFGVDYSHVMRSLPHLRQLVSVYR